MQHLPYKNDEEFQVLMDIACGDREHWETSSELEKRMLTWNYSLYWRKESAGSFNSPDYQIVIYRRGNPVDAFYVSHDREDEAMVLLASRYPQAVEWPEV
ncbi:hypothetical protein SEA_WEASELS2_242 [Rhodococcus phage Weasels2]|uniref:Uncharacterized protein n=1 Tax=Rhodococcus phage Weasels2 TaxID=1897437 RepID=A0A1I9SAL4_9CAUD|nr:hypothetical protein FDH04_gp174 [Rhodococcus phage Weasels2]AOZ63820.1 hypothetical protein SEA_WEASELS2_242 [Rhodococcus phage Weasels2]